MIEADEAYQATVGVALERLAMVNRNQLGDPQKAAHAILAVVSARNPPRELLLGSDAWARADARVKQISDAMTLWKQLTESTDH